MLLTDSSHVEKVIDVII